MAMADSPSGYTQRGKHGGHPSLQPQRRENRIQETEHVAVSLKDRALAAYKKFSNDWTMNLAAMLSYNVLTSFFPLLLALLTILVLLPVVSNNVPQIASQINQIMPANVRSQINVAQILHNVHHAGGVLAIISIVGLLWGGTNLFGAIESCFAIIFRVKVRNFPRQKLMAVVMIMLFVILLPLSFVSSIFLTAANTTASKILPGFFSGVLGQIASYATSLGALFVLFLAIYVIVPNVPVTWRDAWKGALVAAVAMWIINTIFPAYTAHFINTKQYSAAALATAIVVITWFWFFSVILLIGAQINALSMGIGPWPFDISRILMDYKVPADPGEPTALEAQQRKDQGDFLPFSGVARDSQNVHDVVTPSGKVETRTEAEKDRDNKRS
jgi:membrane protein